MPQLPVRREDHVFISGIGCSSRFPYYVNTYGFHTIHGRAPAIASGVRLANPDLHVWVVTGDGDALSIGGNHLLHVLRRNFNLTILLFNNRIYGLTKGQYSPTSELGKRTKSSPMGSIDHPFNPIGVALGSNATFVARTYDANPAHMVEVFRAAHDHEGAAFVEILQNCVIFNDGAFDPVTAKKQRAAHQLVLRHGEPMLFAGGEKGIAFDCEGRPRVVDATDEAERRLVAVHDAHDPNPGRAFAMAHFELPEFPVPVGIFRQVERPTYEELLDGQIAEAKERTPADFAALLRKGYTWEVGGDGS